MSSYECVCGLAVVEYWRPRKMIYANILLIAIDIDNKDAERDRMKIIEIIRLSRKSTVRHRCLLVISIYLK